MGWWATHAIPISSSASEAKALGTLQIGLLLWSNTENFWPNYSLQTILTDFPFSFANVSNTKLVNRPNMYFFVKFYTKMCLLIKKDKCMLAQPVW